ncbi:LacI family transcriptional regulator [Bifidobacterium reuteri]|uniref:LacI family transcriptional regulator n=1 Tax=Bifidobacterium reuteri TaxID=983706 RepID=A0A5J5E9H3_9BIFI|nr:MULTISPECIES: LacI family DNA-binding transcriptional regulator [Bifidobacterium]KAA8825963.1 LacI family transcriptional regulator [Bifidobacterium reuteri]TPF88884.1 hypothetical protein BW10_08325 [Bifidobacterium sp. UTBIF-56]
MTKQQTDQHQADATEAPVPLTPETIEPTAESATPAVTHIESSHRTNAVDSATAAAAAKPSTPALSSTAPSTPAAPSPQPPQKATIYDVADRAGVSYATVSRYLNGHPNVSAKTAARIDKAVRETAYIPSTSARSLAQQRTHIIALIIHGASSDVLTDPNIAQIMASANERVTREGWQLVTMISDENIAANNIKQLVAGGFADGYLLYTLSKNDPLLSLLAERSLPAVVCGTGFNESIACPSVDVDNLTAMSGLVRYVLAPKGTLARRRPAYICGPLNMPGAPERLAAFVNVTSEMLPTSVDHPICYSADWKTTSGADAIREWHETGVLDDVDAVICANDTLAVGAIQELQRLGKDVPGDVAVSGFDNSSAATSITPQITTVDQHMDQRGLMMADVVIKTIGGERSPRVVHMPTDLVIRESA